MLTFLKFGANIADKNEFNVSSVAHQRQLKQIDAIFRLYLLSNYPRIWLTTSYYCMNSAIIAEISFLKYLYGPIHVRHNDLRYNLLFLFWH